MLLATDLDGTLLGHDSYLEKFNEIWLQRHAWRGSVLVHFMINVALSRYLMTQ